MGEDGAEDEAEETAEDEAGDGFAEGEEAGAEEDAGEGGAVAAGGVGEGFDDVPDVGEVEVGGDAEVEDGLVAYAEGVAVGPPWVAAYPFESFPHEDDEE